MTLTMGAVTIDCLNPRQLAEFWTAALGYVVTSDFEGEFLFLGPQDKESDAGISLGLQRVDEPRVGKNRVHVDFHVDDRAAEVARLQELGATAVAEQQMSGFGWVVLQDPEGNEFCVASSTG